MANRSKQSPANIAPSRDHRHACAGRPSGVRRGALHRPVESLPPQKPPLRPRPAIRAAATRAVDFVPRVGPRSVSRNPSGQSRLARTKHRPPGSAAASEATYATDSKYNTRRRPPRWPVEASAMDPHSRARGLSSVDNIRGSTRLPLSLLRRAIPDREDYSRATGRPLAGAPAIGASRADPPAEPDERDADARTSPRRLP